MVVAVVTTVMVVVIFDVVDCENLRSRPNVEKIVKPATRATSR